MLRGPARPGVFWRAVHTTGALFRHATLGFIAGLLFGGLCFLATRPVGIATSFGLADAWFDYVYATGGALVSLLLFVLLVGGGVIAGCVLFLRRGFNALRSPDTSLYGFCTGSRGPKVNDEPQLTDWLHERINALAGLAVKGRPLTIGELARNKPSIQFRMVTTNLSHARPYIFPRSKQDLIFRGDDMRRLFPPEVVEYLITYETSHPVPDVQARRTREAKNREPLPKDHYYLPAGDDLPVIVATRLSLSFPVLLSAVRLFTVKGPKGSKVEQEDLEEHWFSDGGIAANFPLSMFDRWIPSRPTFGINLGDGPVPSRFTPRADTGKKQVFRLAARDTYKSMPQPAPIKGLLGLFQAMLDTARNARDNAQMGLASYRERVAHVYLKADEGGLNLEMPDTTIAAIKEKGIQAAQEFLGGPGKAPFNFDEHRWVRLLLLMDRLEDQLFAVRDLVPPGPNRFAALREELTGLFARQEIARASKVKAERWYRPRDEKWCDEAKLRVEAFIQLVEHWDAAQLELARRTSAKPPPTGFFKGEAPKPRGTLRVTSEL